MKSAVDVDTCIGCELCVQACPDVFRMEGDKAVVYIGEVPSGNEEDCHEAADQCPVDAITIEE